MSHTPRESVNLTHVQTMLGTIQQLTMVLAHTGPAMTEDGTTSPRFSEVAIAAENSLIKALERLDRIVDDNDRWSLGEIKNLEEKLASVYEANATLLAVRAEVDAQALLPHVKYKPIIMRLAGGWLAVYGDPQFLDKAIVGFGDTPQAALKCFDMLFKGEVPDELFAWLTQHGVSINYEQETGTVDGTGNINLDEPSSSGEDDSGNIDPASPDGASGGPKD